jgi:hypothetical protein
LRGAFGHYGFTSSTCVAASHRPHIKLLIAGKKYLSQATCREIRALADLPSPKHVLSAGLVESIPLRPVVSESGYTTWSGFGPWRFRHGIWA